MMAGVYDGIAASTLAMIKAKGVRVTLTRTTVTLDPVTQDSESESVEYNMHVVGLPAGDGAVVHVGSLERRNIIEMHIALKGVGVEPLPGDSVQWGGFAWRVLKVPQVFKPDAVTPIYAKAYLER